MSDLATPRNSDPLPTSPITDLPIDIGVVGRVGRATVSPWGAITPWSESGESTPLDWFIAADDRWHVPADETAVRQQRIDGTPVVETRVRVPGGDTVQRVFAVAEGDGVIVVEFENDSTMPIAVAVAGRPVVTERPTSDVPIQGIDLPSDAVLVPIGHRSTVRVVLGLDPDRPAITEFPRRLPDAATVVRGWEATCDRSSRLLLPDERVVTDVVAARCALLLAGPINADDDPVGFVIDAAELVRLGEPAEPWLIETAAIIEDLVPRRRRRRNSPDVPPHELSEALRAVATIAAHADDERAYSDAVALLAGVETAGQTPGSAVVESPSIGRFIAGVERRVADGGELFPLGFQRSWLGANFEVHDVPTGPKSAVSFGVRWHGARPALLWEQTGVPQLLRASAIDPDWSTHEVSGETLLAAPSGADEAIVADEPAAEPSQPESERTQASPPPSIPDEPPTSFS